MDVDWDFIREEILEMLETHNVTEQTLTRLHDRVGKFVKNIEENFKEPDFEPENPDHVEW